jgi:hypothetical protein
MAAEPGRPLRVALVVPDLAVPEWVAWTAGRIAADERCELAAVVRAPGGGGGGGAAARVRAAYDRLDARVFGAAGALRPARLEPVAGDGDVDVVVSFLPAGRRCWPGSPPRLGTWTLAPLDDGGPGGPPERARDVGLRAPAETALVALDGDGPARVVGRCTSPADPLSVTRTRDAAAWAGARLVLRALRRAARDGAPAAGDAAVGGSPPAGPAALALHAARTGARGVAARGRGAWSRDEWFIAVRERSADGRIVGPPRVVPNPPGRYLCDPFAFEAGGRHFVFCEDLDLATGRGAISAFELDADGAPGPPQRVLERDHHLSYPFVFAHDGAVHMVPETGEAGRIELLTAVHLPGPWRLERVLMDGITAHDATLYLAGDGTWWLFASVVEGPADPGAGRRLDAAPGQPDRDRPGPLAAGRATVPARRRPLPSGPGRLPPLRRGHRPEPRRHALADRVPRGAGRPDRPRLAARPRRHPHLHVRLPLRVPGRRTAGAAVLSRRQRRARVAAGVVVGRAGYPCW